MLSLKRYPERPRGSLDPGLGSQGGGQHAALLLHGLQAPRTEAKSLFVSVLFYLFAIGVLVSALSVVTRKNPIAAAVSLVVCFFCLSAMYAMLDAHFVAVTQVLVYAGAIMVLFIFVIMLLNLRGEGGFVRPSLAPRALAGVAAAGLVGTGIVFALSAVTARLRADSSAEFGTIEQVGRTIFSGPYLIQFEVASALLTVAMVGAVVLAKRDL